jgi:hypothetical protein
MWAAFAVLALIVAGLTTPALAGGGGGDPEAGGPGTPGITQGGDIQFVANIPYPYGTDEEFATFTVTKLSDGATGTPVCQTNADGSCMTDASGNTIYQTEERDFAFVGSENVSGYVIDITDPRTPVIVAPLPCRASQNDIQIWHNILLQSQDGTGGSCTKPSGGKQTQVTIGFSDISDPRAPKFLGKLTESRGAHNATVYPTQPIVYISNSDIPSTSAVIHIWDFSNPAAPVKVQDWTINPALAFSPHDITFNASGTRAYVAAIDHTDILDTTDPRNPSLISVIPNEGISISHQADPTPDGRYLLVSDELGGGGAPTASPGGPVHVYDLSVEQHPQKVGAIGNDCVVTSCDGAAVHVSTAHVFRINPDGYTMSIAWYNDGVHVIDFSDIRGISAGGSGASGLGARTIAWIKMPNANTWSAKMWQSRHPGYVFANDINRGFDVFYVPELGPGFLATGAVHGANPATKTASGVVESEIEQLCDPPPRSQGSDGYAITLPPELGDGNHTISVKGVSAAPYDLDVWFKDADCVHMTGTGLQDGSDPSGRIPEGARFAVVDLYTGANVRFTATSAYSPAPPDELGSGIASKTGR